MRTFAVVVAVLLSLVATAALFAWLAGWEVGGDFSDGRAPQLVWLASIGALMAAGIVASLRQRFSQTVFSLFAWVGIFLLLALGYSYRDEAKALWARIRAELFTGEVRTVGAGEVEIRRSPDSHFYLEAKVNGTVVRFIVDTGATTVALSWADARAVGLDPAGLSFNQPTMTANGPAMVAGIAIDRLIVGSIERLDIRAAVLPEGIEESLLGLSFLDTLKSYEISGDRMTLRD